MEQVIRAAVQGVGRDDRITGLCDIQNCIGNRGLTGGERQRGDATIQRGETLLKNICRRIHESGINVAEFLESE